MKTPYESGNKNQTTTWAACVDFYETLAARHPTVLRFSQLGLSDAGVPLHVGVVSADGVFDSAAIRAAGRPVFFNNNGIHPGEPEGIDACMALVRDLCVNSDALAALGNTVYLFIPIYNVEGALMRGDKSRVNQEGPEAFGFRGNSQHLDLNRDFIKCDSLNARRFNELFAAWDPDVMVDTHTSNGADYAYTMTLIHTQPDKLGSGLGPFLRQTMLPAVYAGMSARGWPTCPYVNPIGESPDGGIADFLEVPRFSTGYAALNHTIGFMPETHMLKPFRDRYESMRALLDVTLAFTIEHATTIQALRREARQQYRASPQWPVHWSMDSTRVSSFRFQGYKATHAPSRIGRYQRLAYDRSRPWERDIPYFDNFVADATVTAPQAYVVPASWRDVIERLALNGVVMTRVSETTTVQARVYRITSVDGRPGPYEGHLFHDTVTLETSMQTMTVNPGDMWIPVQQDKIRYVVETLEPQAHDSFFRWGFFNGMLERKGHFSDYVFEDKAEQLLKDEPALRASFDRWSAANPEALTDQQQVLTFIFDHCERFAEPAWRRYPVFAVL